MGGVDFINDKEVFGSRSNKIEEFCNEFAGVFLAPDEDFLHQKGEDPTDDEVKRLAKLYSVSREVIFRKFLKHGLISRKEYQDIHDKLKLSNDNYRKVAANKSNESKKFAGNYYSTQVSYKGKRYVELAYDSYFSHKITLPQLATYMNMKIPSIKKLALEKNYGSIE
jgi:Zn-dependent peptidase ImmA (M78 family)